MFSVTSRTMVRLKGLGFRLMLGLEQALSLGLCYGLLKDYA